MDTPPLPREQPADSDNVGAAAEDVAASPRRLAGAQATSDRICVAAARNVLVVDDNDRHLDILNTILTSVGHDVELCGSGADALRRLAMRHYDVVVLDMVMPEISGLVVARQMRAGGLNRHTPVIVCTASLPIARRQLVDVEGITALIGKPIDMATLILAIARAPIREHLARSGSLQIRL